MSGYRNLPPAAHSDSVMADPANRAVFATFIDAEQELLSLLQHRVTDDLSMLDMMDKASG
jgi:hypothetical protein